MTHIPTPQQLHQTLLQADNYPHPAEHIEHISTHISDLYLAGDYVYKLKKNRKFGFLDFSTLARRKFYCEEEIRLNRRFAPELYLRVIPLSCRNGQIRLDDTEGEIIDYAVVMRRFDRGQELDVLLQAGKLTLEHIIELAETIATFHQHIPAAKADSPWGNPAAVIQPIRDNFTELYRHPHSAGQQALLAQTAAWVEQEWTRVSALAVERKQQGFIRECHGDLHLGNIALIDDKITPFDGIEFNPALYWIDVMSELAFPLMDLESYQRPNYANELLNQYLSHSGDYAGLQMLTLYKVYRALVRAKVDALQAAQQDDEQSRKPFSTRTEHYIALAARYTQPKTPVLFITHGLSGAGKTWQSRNIARETGVIHLRSDVERKRLFAGCTESLYSAATTEQTYQYLLQCAKTLLQSGFSPLVDATFTDRRYRDWFADLAATQQTRCVILDFVTPEEQLRKNISQRQQQGTDASDADLSVLEQQLQRYQPLSADEDYLTLAFGQPLPLAQLKALA